MNLFLSKQKGRRRSTKIKGLSVSSLSQILLKAGTAYQRVSRRATRVLSLHGRRYLDIYDRRLDVKVLKHLETITREASWRSLRHKQGLPVRGQRTHTNARTARRLIPVSLSRIKGI